MNFQLYKLSTIIWRFVVFLVFMGVLWYLKPNGAALYIGVMLVVIMNMYDTRVNASMSIRGDILTIITKNIFGRTYENSFPITEGRYAMRLQETKSLEIYDSGKYCVLSLSTGRKTITAEEVDAVAALLEQHGMKKGEMVVRFFRKVWRPA